MMCRRVWPGLAHFLEHLLFLGTERFPADDNLMTFVQRHGGQVNASTRERCTDFFFELPQPVFAQGLERLCDMLAHPRMTLADQQREREVLHAEFIAWSRDAEARYQLTLLQALSPLHPLRAFHAGNRYSLPVPRQDFQRALQDFYLRFYQAGQMTLSLTGPQSLAELKALAAVYGGYFAPGRKVEHIAPPRLLNSTPAAQLVCDPSRLTLLFACEDLPDHSAEAVTFLCTWLTHAGRGGLLFELQQRGLIEALKAEPVYQFDRQLLLLVDFTLTSEGIAQRGLICAALFDWLGFFTEHWPALTDEYARLQQRRLLVDGALELTRQAVEPEAYLSAMPALLKQLNRTQLLQPVDNLPIDPIDWRLPDTNPFLHDTADTAEGAIYLRWRLDAAHPDLWKTLDQDLQALKHQAKTAGVSLSFSAYGPYWQLALTGLSAPMPTLLQQVFKRLTAPVSTRLPADDATLIPIRQLLKRLPDLFLGANTADENLSTVWPSARWTLFSTQPLDIEIPGTPDDQTLTAPTLKSGKHWHKKTSDGSEHAVLLFCPTPSNSLEDEAAWRLLAHLGQAPFYQRLRVELQLGYAVFSGFRQIAGRPGWLFGVQSPHASVEEIVSHLESFIGQLPTLIENLDLPSQIQALIGQFDADAMDLQQRSEWLWQAHLAGHDDTYPQQWCNALLHCGKQQLLKAAEQLERATGGWLIATNGG